LDRDGSIGYSPSALLSPELRKKMSKSANELKKEGFSIKKQIIESQEFDNLIKAISGSAKKHQKLE